MSSTTKLNGRYEIKEMIGEGGMGIVYRAVDLEMQSDVAVKTIKELLDPQQIELFRRECAVLRKLRHPNVVDLYDFGITGDDDLQKPFFVMPYLPGATLDKLIRTHAARLTPDRVVDIVTQTARGLQAAHDLGLIHRDVKPSNIFVLGDDSVKLIDFGVVHLANHHSRTGFKGTLLYMSPEQLEMNPPTAVSDVFSLAVVCYEALTHRRPFTGNNENEIRDSIRHLIPPPVSELNPAVSLSLSQAIHAAMAKQPWHRTSTARQFAEELQKALHGQTIDRFEPGRIEPRIVRAQKALETSQYDFAAEILGEIEAEGHIHPAIRSLRRQIDQALRAKAVKQALDSAHHRFVENEYQLALQKVDDVLRMDPVNAEALALKSEIEGKHRTQQIDNWFRLAQDHIRNYAFHHARQALQNVLRLKPTNTTAIQMLSEVDRRENEYLREHQEKEELHKAALEAWHRGEISVALSKLERVLELDRRAPDNASSESGVSYQNLYNQVRSEHDRIKNAYEEARKLLAEDDFSGALVICEQVLAKFPEQALLQALKFDIGERQRQYVSAYIVKVDRDVEAEPDLDRKLAILSEAQVLYPEEAHFRERLEKITSRRDLVATITEKIRNLEERGQYPEALGQLEIVRAIYPQYPGIALEVDRISKRRDQQSRADARARWVNQIDRALNTGDFSHSLNLLRAALAEFPDDAELLAQERLASAGLDRCLEAARVFEAAQILCAQGDVKGGLDGLWQAHRLDERNPLIQAVLVETLLKHASAELDRDQTLSEQLVRQAIELDPGSSLAENLQRMVRDRQKAAAVDRILSRSREAQAAGDLIAAMAVIEKGLDSYPGEPRFLARKEALLKLLSGVRGPEEKQKDLTEMGELKERMREAPDVASLNSIMDRTRVIARKHPGDHDVESVFKSVEDLWSKTTFPAAGAAAAAPRHDAGQAGAGSGENSWAGPNTAVDELAEAEDRQAAARPATAAQGRRGMRGPLAALSSIPMGRLGIYAAVAIVVLVSFVFVMKRRPAAGPPGAAFAADVTIDASVAGARLLVDGQDRGVAPLKLKLAEGEHKIDATLPGFVSSRPTVLQVARGAVVPPVMVTLEALPPILRVFTEFTQGSLDNQKLKLDGTGYEAADLGAGPHVLKLFSPFAGAVTVEFEMNPGQPPVVHKVESFQTIVVALATLAGNGQLHSSLKALKVGINAPADQEVGEQGVPLSGLMSGRNELALDDGKNPHTESIEVDANPALTILVGANPNAGNLEISETANVEATVSIEPLDKKGKAITPQKLKNGKTTFSRLVPKKYVVEVSAAGYETSRTEAVEVTKGNIATITLSLKALPSTATVEIRGGTPGADLLLDENPSPIGRLGAGGEFTSAAMPTGEHTIRLRKDNFEPGRPIPITFSPGGTASLSGTQVNLIAFGWIDFNVNPPNSRITYSPIGAAGAAQEAKNGETTHLKSGRYSIMVTAEGFQNYSANVEVAAGKGEGANWRLLPIAAPAPAPAPVPVTLGPDRLRGLRFRNATDFECQVPFCSFLEQNAGTYSFKIELNRSRPTLLGGGRHAGWIVNFVDDKNYIEYEFDDKNIKYSVYRSGKKTESSPVPHGMSASDGNFYTVAISVSATDIRIASAGKPVPIPSPAGNMLAGKFAFARGGVIKEFQFTETRGR